MPFYKGRGGSIFEMDLPNPKLVHQVELREEKIRKGDLVEVPADKVRKVEQPGGGYKWVDADPEPDTPKGRRKLKPADADPESETPADGDD